MHAHYRKLFKVLQGALNIWILDCECKDLLVVVTVKRIKECSMRYQLVCFHPMVFSSTLAFLLIGEFPLVTWITQPSGLASGSSIMN